MVCFVLFKLFYPLDSNYCFVCCFVSLFRRDADLSDPSKPHAVFLSEAASTVHIGSKIPSVFVYDYIDNFIVEDDRARVRAAWNAALQPPGRYEVSSLLSKLSNLAHFLLFLASSTDWSFSASY